jgi:uncharacterized protein with GYD domain
MNEEMSHMKFLVRASYTQSGLQGAIKEGFAAREAYIRGLIGNLGAKIEAWYWAYGQDDVFTIIDGDESSVLAISLAVNQSGVAHVSLTPLLTSEQLDAARGKLPNYRGPGT